MAKFSMTKELFKNQWLRHFAKDVDKKDIEEHVKGQFIWHVFSFEHIKNDNLLIGDDARRAFDEADKSEVICHIAQHIADSVFHAERAEEGRCVLHIAYPLLYYFTIIY